MGAPLSMKERELVATGASVAAGCVPCTQYHVKAVRDAGATEEEVMRAIDGALAVKHGTEAVMRRVAGDALGRPTAEAHARCADEVARAADRMTELVAIAAAVAVNCGTTFRRHVERGRAVGVRDDEIQLVVTFARMIRAKATHKMDEATGEAAAAGTVERPTAPGASDRPTAAASAPASCCGASPCA